MNFLKMFITAVIIFITLTTIAFGLSAISDISPIMTVAIFALAIVAYLLSDEVIG